LVGGSCTLGLEGLETIDNASGGTWNVDELAMLVLDRPGLEKEEVWIENLQEASIVPLQQKTWTKKQIEEDQRLEHANELETHTIKKTQTVIWTKKRKEEVKSTIIVDYITSIIKSLVL
jgi:hypothetical protein